MLSWFDKSPELHWWGICVVVAPVLVLLLRPLLQPSWHNAKGSDWRWLAIIVLLLVAGRWPSWFVTRQFNDDESFLIAGAITLRHDPLFFRSVDGGTAGPLDFYALLPVGSLFGRDDYATARITAAILIATALIFTHQTLAGLFGRQVARVATFGATCVEAFTLSPDLLHYPTELVAVSLIALAVWAAFHRFSATRQLRWNLIGGFTLGLVPFAKLQAGPSALLIGGGWLVGEIWRFWRSPDVRAKGALVLSLAAITPSALVISILSLNGEASYAVSSYIFGNLDYTRSIFPLQPNLTALQTLGFLSQLAIRPAYLLGGWTLGAVLWVIVILAVYRPWQRSNALPLMLTASLVLVAVASVLITHRPFFHYCHFLLVPMTLLVGTAFGAVTARMAVETNLQRACVVCALLVCTTAPLLWSRSGGMFPYLGVLTQLQRYRLGSVSYEITKYANPGEPLGLWGWMSRYYVEGGFRQATRYANSMGAIQPGRFQQLYRKCYLEDFRQTSPPVFVDTVGVDNVYLPDRQEAHEESLPALAMIIRSNYTFVAERQSTRIYVRNDRLNERH